MLTGQRVLITGATGQVARPIAEQLNARNEVWAAARFRDEEARAELEAAGIHTAAFTLGDAVLTHLPDVDYVIHCAANVAPKSADAGIAINAEGTGFLMERYRDASGFFHMSSSSVYRAGPDPTTAFTEGDPLGGEASYSPHYAMSKLASEAVVRFQSRQLGLPAVVARLNVAYGTSGHGGLPMVLYEFLRNGMPYAKRPDADSWCSPIHQDDIVQQVQGLLDHATVGARIVNLGGDEVTTIEEIIDHLEALTGLTMKIEAAQRAVWETQVLDPTLRRELAGPCRVPWRDGVRSALEQRYPGAMAG
ncbi:MAG: NAD-dependent epimerase/dehydratase family protein [Acidimicrobiales bacterium]